MMRFHVTPLFLGVLACVGAWCQSSTGDSPQPARILIVTNATAATETEARPEHRSETSRTPDFTLGGSRQLKNLLTSFSSTNRAISDDVCAKGEVCCKYEQDRRASCMSRHECLDTYHGTPVNQEQCK
jgi:hypothetical protein